MEKEAGIFNQEKFLLTEDNRKISEKSIKKISKAGQSWSSFGGSIGFPQVNSTKLVQGEPLKEWIKKPRTEKSEIIYCTWMGAKENVDISYIKKQTEAFKKLDIHPTVFIIDDGWASKSGDWLSVDKQKFPNGIKEATNLIKENNMESWLWIAPLHIGQNSEFAREHPDLLTQKKGKPISFDHKNTCFSKNHYLLDLRKSEAVDYLDQVAKKFKEWGFEGAKIDFLSSLYLIKEMDQKEKQFLTHKTMEIFKEKGLRILASGCPFNAAVGVADYIRLSNDSGLPLPEDNKIINLIFSWRSLKGVKKLRNIVDSFINIDPDMYYSNNTNKLTERNLFEAQRLSVYRAGCLTLGDDFSKLSGVKAEPIKKLIKKFYHAQKLRSNFTAIRTGQKTQTP